MRTFICILLSLAIIGLGIYVGVWIMLVGGIVGLINQLKASTPVDALPFAMSIVQIFFFEIPIVMSVWIVMFCGIMGLSRTPHKWN